MSFSLKKRINYKRKLRKKEELERAKYQQEKNAQYVEFLRFTEETFRINRSDDYDGFLAFRENQRQAMINGPFPYEEWLKDFNNEETRLKSFQERFADEILDFWGWIERSTHMKNLQTQGVFNYVKGSPHDRKIATA